MQVLFEKIQVLPGGSILLHNHALFGARHVFLFQRRSTAACFFLEAKRPVSLVLADLVAVQPAPRQGLTELNRFAGACFRQPTPLRPPGRFVYRFRLVNGSRTGAQSLCRGDKPDTPSAPSSATTHVVPRGAVLLWFFLFLPVPLPPPLPLDGIEQSKQAEDNEDGDKRSYPSSWYCCFRPADFFFFILLLSLHARKPKRKHVADIVRSLSPP